MDILAADNIVKDYTGHRALDNVTMHARQGKVHGLLGPNGAGKTTLIRIINHITAPDSGTVTFNGHPFRAEDVRNIGYMPEERGLYKKMRVGEQAVFFGRLKGLSSRDADRAVREWFERLDIISWWNKKVEELSKGMAQKVQFVITVLHKPDLLIFDEPFSGFDPINANLLKNEILRLRDEGASIIFSTHNMSSVEAVCDSITLINKSKVLLDGDVEDVRRSYGANRYCLTVEDGTRDSLAEALKGIAEVSEIPGAEIKDNEMTVKLADGNSRSKLIDAANRAVNLTSFAPLMPSMDNIFISAVQAASGIENN